MKKAGLLVIALAMVALLGSCDLFGTVKAEDILGEWEFLQVNEIKNTEVFNVHLSVMADESGKIGMLDIGWDVHDGEDLLIRWHGLNGTFSGKKFTGTYQAFYLDETEYNIEVTFTYKNGEIGIACKGEGPPDGITLEHGTKAEI